MTGIFIKHLFVDRKLMPPFDWKGLAGRSFWQIARGSAAVVSSFVQPEFRKAADECPFSFFESWKEAHPRT
jgi:hypothetical protein